MEGALNKLKDILGEGRLKEITSQHSDGDDDDNILNAKEISCECSTVILKPNQARLIVPSDSMIEIEKDLTFLQQNDKTFKNLVRGCYWLVDDMYKFEQMGYTKEVNVSNQRTAKSSETTQSESQKSALSAENQEEQSQTPFQAGDDKLNNPTSSHVANGLRYLACAECNLCPLGWYDSKTKESYLYVW